MARGVEHPALAVGHKVLDGLRAARAVGGPVDQGVDPNADRASCGGLLKDQAPHVITELFGHGGDGCRGTGAGGMSFFFMHTTVSACAVRGRLPGVFIFL